MQMKKTLKKRITEFFINMGRKHKLFRIPAITGLAASLCIFYVIGYFRKGTKRFACAAFILLCFIVGNSFAYPVFQEDNGFIAEAAGTEPVTISEDISIALADEENPEIDELVFLEDEDVLEEYGEAELYSMEEVDKYSLSEILEDGTNSEKEKKEVYEQQTQTADSSDFSSDDWRLVLINKQHSIPDGYEFTLGTIKTIKGNMQCDERIIDELLSMMQAAKQEDVNLAICSPYRDLNYQSVLFNRKIEAYMKKGMSYMDAYAIASQAVTVPGASEHQIGLAIDIISDNYVTLDEGFADTDAGRWLAEHSCEYGFILRYPLGKEHITSIEFEPWHFRYVGREAATIIMKEGITLEEFWDKYL